MSHSYRSQLEALVPNPHRCRGADVAGLGLTAPQAVEMLHGSTCSGVFWVTLVSSITGGFTHFQL